MLKSLCGTQLSEAKPLEKHWFSQENWGGERGDRASQPASHTELKAWGVAGCGENDGRVVMYVGKVGW